MNPAKDLLLLGVALIALAGCRQKNDSPTPAVKPVIGSTNAASAAVPAGMIRLQNVELRQVLTLYEALAGRQLLIADSNSPLSGTITYANDHPLTREEAMTQLADAIHTQTGLVITNLDSRHDLLVRDPAGKKP